MFENVLPALDPHGYWVCGKSTAEDLKSPAPWGVRVQVSPPAPGVYAALNLDCTLVTLRALTCPLGLDRIELNITRLIPASFHADISNEEEVGTRLIVSDSEENLPAGKESLG